MIDIPFFSFQAFVSFGCDDERIDASMPDHSLFASLQLASFLQFTIVHRNSAIMSMILRWVVLAIILVSVKAWTINGFVRIRSSSNSRSSSSTLLRRNERKSMIIRAIEHVTTTDEFEAITSKSTSKVPVIIDFQKSACKPCMKIAPAFEALSQQYEGRAKFYKVDADSSKEALSLMKTMGVRSVPTFHIWNAGERIESIQGAHLDEVEYTLKLELEKPNATS